VARYGPPDDPNHSDQEPTRYANYGDQTNQGNFGDYGQRPYPPSGEAGPPPTEPLPWYRKPVALVAFGAVGAVLIA